MHMDNTKNYTLSPAAQDLGLGDLLRQQVENETEEARKKRMLAMGLKPTGGGLAVMRLFGGGLGG